MQAELLERSDFVRKVQPSFYISNSCYQHIKIAFFVKQVMRVKYL